MEVNVFTHRAFGLAIVSIAPAIANSNAGVLQHKKSPPCGERDGGDRNVMTLACRHNRRNLPLCSARFCSKVNVRRIAHR